MSLKDAFQQYGMGITTDAPATDAEKACSALNSLQAANYGYDEWKNLCIAFKAANGELEDWLAWCSIDAPRYDEKTATKLFNSVDKDGATTDLTLWRYAWGAGWKWHGEFIKQTVVKTVPNVEEFTSGGEQAIAQLEAMFAPDEYVNIVTYAKWDEKNSKWKPGNSGKTYRRADLCEAIRTQGLDSALGGYNHDAGIWMRVNPMDGQYIEDSNVAAYRYALIESDDMALKDQKRMLFEMNLPMVCITNSGGKSLHAIVRIDADGKNHYADRVRYLHDECKKLGFSVDGANKNPSRLTRLAGAARGEREQTLIHVNVGAKDFTTWQAQEKAAKLAYDYGIEPMDMETQPVLDEVLIDGVMRRGDKMCVAGASKSFKSFSLVQLAIAVACGSKWFGWECKRGRVLYINCELRGESFRKRVWEVADAMHADRKAISANMDVWNMRGSTEPLRQAKKRIIEQAHERDYDMVILDPIYKLFDGDENKAQDVAEILQDMDELAATLHASVIYCHHHSKGAKGDRNAQDRFSGSGVFARDCDELVDISPLELGNIDLTEYGFSGLATAWRIETVIRDFAPKAAVDSVFDYPTHHIDNTGYLSECKIVSPQSIGGTRSGEKRSKQADDNAIKLANYCAEHFKFSHEPLTMGELAEVFERDKRTIKRWAERSERLEIKQIGKAEIVVLRH